MDGDYWYCCLQLRQLNSRSPPATASEIAAVPAINITADQLGWYHLEFIVCHCWLLFSFNVSVLMRALHNTLDFLEKKKQTYWHVFVVKILKN